MAILQTVIASALVVASLLLSAWWLTPARRRLWVLDHLVPAGTTRGALARLRRALLARSKIGCQACRANPSAPAPRSTETGAGLRR